MSQRVYSVTIESNMLARSEDQALEQFRDMVFLSSNPVLCRVEWRSDEKERCVKFVVLEPDQFEIV